MRMYTFLISIKKSVINIINSVIFNLCSTTIIRKQAYTLNWNINKQNANTNFQNNTIENKT